MKGKKVVITIISILVAMVLISCSEKEKYSNPQADLFDMKKAGEISKSYLNNICMGQFEIANDFCSEELINSNKEITTGVSNITAYSVDSFIEGSDFGYFLFNVIRSSTIEPKSDLENYTVKVERINDEYKITQIQASSQKELYVRGNGVRVIGDDGAKSSLIVTLNNIPKDTYLRENKLMLYKDKVPNDSFSNVALSFSGQKVAITTTDNKDSYVCIANIDNTLMTLAPNVQGDTEATVSTEIDNLQEIFEKSIAKDIISVDLFKDSKITKVIFSREDNILSVQYKNKFSADRINLYKTEDGTIIEGKLNEIFPENKYNVNDGIFEDEEFKFRVSALEGVSDVSNELIGNYKIDLSTLEIKKL